MKRMLIALVLVLTLACTLTSCGLQVPRPEIKEGRFDFSITYEIFGEVNTLSATYVCEFDGTSWSLEGGSYSRDWVDYVEGNYEGDDYSAKIGTTDDGGDIWLFFGIYPEYFMGDPEIGDRGIPEPMLYISYPEDETGGMGYNGVQEDIAERYGAKIISYEYANPLDNEFAVFN